MPVLSAPSILLGLGLGGALVGTLLFGIYHRRSREGARVGAEEQKMAAVGTATARILHQVKNPLQTIILHAELIRESALGADPKARAEISNAIALEAQRMSSMLEELSAYLSGIGRGLRKEPVALHELVRDLARSEARKSGLAVETKAIEECTVLADAYYLRQALENLIANARDAMAGQPSGQLTLQLERQGESAVVGVIDNGPGIPPDQTEAIFQPFVTGKSKGMGLGLAIAREIVEGHGGRIAVHSRPGAGSRFEVILPVDDTARASADQTPGGG